MQAQGMIIRALSGFYDVLCDGQTVRCRARGRLRFEENAPLVGDRVCIDSRAGIVLQILPRKNAFIRPAVANLDLLVVFASAAIPKTDPFLIDRVAAIAAGQEVAVVLVVNKIDLDPAEELQRIYRHAGFDVIAASAATGQGTDRLRQAISGRLCAFTGNSGVGKSSLLNRLEPGLGLAVGQVSQKLGRGRHTTRHTELHALPGNTWAADTPGFSSFDTDRMDLVIKENLQYAFPDFAPYLGHCRFHDCAHLAEPDCAITAAVEKGELEKTRYDSYVRLYRHAAALARK